MAATKANALNQTTAKKQVSAPQRGKPSSAASGAEPSRVKPKSDLRVDVGEKLPNVTLPDQNGEPFSLASLRGKPAVVYFYPKDDTPGCTREACAFQENLAALARQHVKVVGISPDAPSRHTKFAEKYGLKFTLLSDVDREYARACGVLVPKTLYGRTSIGIERTTYLLDREGVIRKVWRKVKVDGHIDAIVDALRSAAVK